MLERAKEARYTAACLEGICWARGNGQEEESLSVQVVKSMPGAINGSRLQEVQVTMGFDLQLGSLAAQLAGPCQPNREYPIL
eukprot:1160379-Pelagomonas_calceolata.AAC.18